MKSKFQLVKEIDTAITFSNPPMSNSDIGKLIDKVNHEHGTDIRAGDIPCLMSAPVSSADVREEKTSVNGAAIVILSAAIPILGGHMMCPDYPWQKAALLGAIAAGSVAMTEPLTEITKRHGGTAVLGLMGTGLAVLGTGAIRRYWGDDDQD